jgi:hypothetical protein
VSRCEPVWWRYKGRGQVREDSLTQGVAVVLEGYYGVLVRCEWRWQRLLDGVVEQGLAHVESSVETIKISFDSWAAIQTTTIMGTDDISLTYSFTSARFCVLGSNFSIPWLSQPWFLPALLDAIETSCFTSTGAAKNSLDSSNILAMSRGGTPPVSGLFLMKTKPYLEAADKSCSGALALEDEMSMTGMFAFERSILCGREAAPVSVSGCSFE